MTFLFGAPWLLLLGLLAVLPLLRRPRRGGVAFGPFALARMTLKPSKGPLLWRLLIAGALLCFAVAAARPQFGRSLQIHEAHGRDLVLVIDLSLSMFTDDMADADGEPVDRLTAVAEAAKAFIAGRPNDRVALVFFAEHAVTSCPLTFDHRTVIDFLDRAVERQLEQWHLGLSQRRVRNITALGEGTNLGLGLGIALKRLDRSETRGRAVVLVTDGRDSRELPNWIDPIEGARHARELGVRIYAIGVGDPDGRMTDIQALYFHNLRRTVPVSRAMLPDMQRLRDITARAEGLTMHADDRDELGTIFARIDELEPSPHEVRSVTDVSDRFQLPLVLGLVLLAAALACEARLRGAP